MNTEGIFNTATAKPITEKQQADIFEAIKKASESRGSIGEIRIIHSQILPDDVVIVSDHIYRIITADD